MSIGLNLNNFNSSYGISRIPVVTPEDVAAQDRLAKQGNTAPAAQVEAPKAVVEETPAVRASKVANLEDISLTFNKEDTFDNIGADVDINGLDMSKAISDMKRDSILADYQTFVGPTADQLIAGLNDGVVVMK